MIKKESNAYKQIKDNIAKLTIIQQATRFSPEILIQIHVAYCCDLFEMVNADKIKTKTFYKYFTKESGKYLIENQSSKAY
jgi:hypothetical protein